MAGKRNVKKNPFMIVVRYNDWEPGMYRVLPSDPFENTRAALTAKDDVLAASGIDPATVIREHGGMMIAVAQFTDVNEAEPNNDEIGRAHV